MAEYLKFAELGRDFAKYRNQPDSFHYPFMKTNNTERAKDDSPNWYIKTAV